MKLKKYFLFLTATALIISQTAFFPARPAAAAESAPLFEAVNLLPESDVVMAMDFERTLNVAAPAMLDGDARKIENLKKLMTSIENRIGLDLYNIRQIAVGYKLPPAPAQSYVENAAFAVIIRTAGSNADLLDKWAQRISQITAFDEEKKPVRQYISEFKNFRSVDERFESTSTLRLAQINQLEESLKTLTALEQKLKALPRPSTPPAALDGVQKSARNLRTTVGKTITVLKIAPAAKQLRADSIKLQNRLSAVSLDDPQRKPTVAALTAEAKILHAAYQPKIKAMEAAETLFDSLQEELEDERSITGDLTNKLSEIEKKLATLPVPRAARSAAVNDFSDVLTTLDETFNSKLALLETADKIGEAPSPAEIAKPAEDFYRNLKSLQTEKLVNGKKMIVINLASHSPTLAAVPDAPAAVDTDTPSFVVQEIPSVPSEIAVGYLDEQTLAIGLEKSVSEILKRDANYKNQKAAEMIDSAGNSLFAFAVNSQIARRFSDDLNPTRDSAVLLPGAGLAFSTNNLTKSFMRDVNFYGSVNCNVEKNPTNDLTMTVGFFKDNVAGSLPEVSADNTDSTFDLGGFEISNRIFYDLLGSFKAVNASLTFKFEKQRLAALVRSTPRIIDSVKPKEKKTTAAQTAAARPKRPLNSLEEVLTTPELYIDILKALNGSL